MLTRKEQSENLRDELYRCVSYSVENAVSDVLEERIWDRTSASPVYRIAIRAFLNRIITKDSHA